MSYTPTTWATGDTITAAGLNKMEQGIAGAGTVVIFPCFINGDDDNRRIVIDASVNDFVNASRAGNAVFAVGRLTDNDGGYDFDMSVQFILLAVGTEYGNPIIQLYGYDPYSGGNPSFYPDASGETMSTDGGYVP